MKFIHLSDLHLGIRVNGFSMIEDQKHVLSQVKDIAVREHADAVLIAGDVYDKSIPSQDAMQLLDSFLTSLAEAGIRTFVIPGNHDSADRLRFAADLLKDRGVYLAPEFCGKLTKNVMYDVFGPVNIYMLPFIRPSMVRSCTEDPSAVKDYTDAVRAVVESSGVDTSERNVLLSHQFVCGSVRCESEELSIGGTDAVDASVYEPFDYVALGHLHRPQRVAGKETIRYSGSPCKYSFSETQDCKSVPVIEMKEKGEVSVTIFPVELLHDMKHVKGTYEEVTSKSFYKDLNTSDYYRITLTDKEEILDAFPKLRAVYPNLMRLDRAVLETASVEVSSGSLEGLKDRMTLFSEFYEAVNGEELTADQAEYMEDLFAGLKA